MEEDMWLVSLDVESLYTSIQHKDGMRAVRMFLTMSNYDVGLSNFLMSLLGFALEHNYFLFKNTVYLQKQGTAMGAAFAPSYANLFLGAWERQIFFTNPIADIEKVLFWARFIDDVLMIWQGTEEELLSFVSLLNTNEINVRLTCKRSQTQIEFLDILIRKGESNVLETDVYRKETAVNSLLHASSSHPLNQW
ncbi:unnamed protein product [Ranitomeya imitator]|uniref:Reverse transcriptase domain-containing protein n=1 Tax=Ranitomeya imitator TaxID=111125 RepID=A0ABN9MMC8_9NEOB|nr:unnamed protein product [Ranitomeya imitator]